VGIIRSFNKIKIKKNLKKQYYIIKIPKDKLKFYIISVNDLSNLYPIKTKIVLHYSKISINLIYINSMIYLNK